MLELGPNIIDGKTVLVDQRDGVFRVTFPNWQDGTGVPIYFEVSTLALAYTLVMALIPTIPA